MRLACTPRAPTHTTVTCTTTSTLIRVHLIHQNQYQQCNYTTCHYRLLFDSVHHFKDFLSKHRQLAQLSSALHIILSWLYPLLIMFFRRLCDLCLCFFKKINSQNWSKYLELKTMEIYTQFCPTYLGPFNVSQALSINKLHAAQPILSHFSS